MQQPLQHFAPSKCPMSCASACDPMNVVPYFLCAALTAVVDSGLELIEVVHSNDTFADRVNVQVCDLVESSCGWNDKVDIR